MYDIVPVVLCGGVGARLWPISRQNLPKQFAPLIGDTSLFDEAIRRASATGVGPPIVVTSSDYKFLIQKHLNDCNVAAHVLLEPSRKNTAPAVFAASYFAQNFNDEALVLVMPSDHHIPDEEAFVEMVQSGCAAAIGGSLVTFGIKPESPETGYGYIEICKSTETDCHGVKKFYEKPSLEIAEQMLAAGNYVWNSGIFLFRASTLMGLAHQLEPAMISNVKSSVDEAEQDNNFWQLDTVHWNRVEGQSIDHAVMEKANNICCVEFVGKWSDLGDWNALADQRPRDTSGNLLNKNVTQFDCNDSILWGSSDKMHLVGLGLNNVLAVVTDDAVLVADQSRAQEVKAVVDLLSMENVPQALHHTKDYRPWGWFESLINMPGYQVKRLNVYPGAKLSLQSHQHRSEHWVVVHGTATVMLDEEFVTLETNASVYIEAGQKHRLANNTGDPLIVIEVQTGSYLGEDDILRYDDHYNRA